MGCRDYQQTPVCSISIRSIDAQSVTICGWVEGTTHLCDSVFDNFLVRHITLVSNKQLVHTLSGVSVNLLQPLLDIVEGVHVRDVVDDTDAMCATIVGRGNGSETLLSSGVPLP